MKKGSLQTYEFLKKQILSGCYVAGAQLKENQIAEDMQVSRTPVRAALKQLVDDGLAVAEEGRGVFVAGWTRWDIEDMFQLRIRLEPLAARLACERADANTILKLQQDNVDMEYAIAACIEGKESVSKIQEINSSFHHTLLESSGSKRLVTILGTMIDMPVITRSFFLYSPEDLHRSLQHHKDLVFAIENRNVDLAEQIMSIHLMISNQRFMSLRKDNEKLHKL